MDGFQTIEIPSGSSWSATGLLLEMPPVALLESRRDLRTEHLSG